jgi:hypothetical protein
MTDDSAAERRWLAWWDSLPADIRAYLKTTCEHERTPGESGSRNWLCPDPVLPRTRLYGPAGKLALVCPPV